MTVGENLQLSTLRKAGKVFRGGSWLRANDTQIANIIHELQIEPDDPSLPIRSLSGGNQQKVVIGRALLASPTVLLLSEPTAGVDVEARRAIRELVWQRAAAGLGVILVSSDLEDLIMMPDRVVAICDGVARGEVDRSDLTEALLIELMEEATMALAQ
jgi:ABC-type sugar transport system ATPase subunit